MATPEAQVDCAKLSERNSFPSSSKRHLSFGIQVGNQSALGRAQEVRSRKEEWERKTKDRKGFF